MEIKEKTIDVNYFCYTSAVPFYVMSHCHLVVNKEIQNLVNYQDTSLLIAVSFDLELVLY